jgi:hypothetical protein
MEKSLDDLIGRVLGLAQGHRSAVAGLVLAGAALCWQQLRALLAAQLAALQSALSAGLSARQLGAGLALGLASGLGPPGLTMFLALPLGSTRLLLCLFLFVNVCSCLFLFVLVCSCFCFFLFSLAQLFASLLLWALSARAPCSRWPWRSTRSARRWTCWCGTRCFRAWAARCCRAANMCDPLLLAPSPTWWRFPSCWSRSISPSAPLRNSF